MRTPYILSTTLIKTLILASIMVGVFAVSVAAQAYSYPNPPTSAGAVTTPNTVCSGSFVRSLGGEGSDAPPSAPSWSVLAWGFLGGYLLPSDYNAPGSYCIQATRFSNVSTWSISYALYNGAGTTGQSGKYTLTYVSAATSPTASISFSPSTITSGNSSALTWSSTNASTCTGTGFVTSNGTAGTVSVSPSQTTTYSVSCTGAGGTTSASATLTVTPANPSPTINSFSVSPSTIDSGGSATITWSSSNTSYCSSSQFDTLGATSGSVTVTPSSSTTYTLTCTGTSSGSGTWQYYASDYSDVSCPVTSTTNIYSGVANCPTSPQGKACSGSSSCKINTIGPGCGVTTDVYTCQSSSPPASVSNTTSVYVTAPSGPLSTSCSASPASVYTGETVTWSSSTSGGNGSYTYSWSGTDGLSGVAASIAKIYSTVGTKTASVTVTSPAGAPSVVLLGGRQCSGGTSVGGGYGTTEDGVGFTRDAEYTISQTCAEYAPTTSDSCCNVVIEERVDSMGQPINTIYQYNFSINSTTVQKDSTSLHTGGNGTNTNYYAGLVRTSPSSTVTASCSNSASVIASLPDVTTGSVSPLSTTAGVSTTYTVGVTNSASQATSAFGSTVYVCLASDTTCLNNHLAKAPTFFDIVLSFFGRIAEAGTSIKIPMSRISLSAGASGSQTGSYTFSTSGAYKIRSCADTPLNEVAESNENNNCSAWVDFTVNPSTLNATCSVSPSSGYTGDNITWTASPTGGVGSYTYSWAGTDSLSGTTQSVVKQYTTSGTKTGSVTVTSGAQTVTRACSNSISIATSPTALLTASPSSIIRGSGSSQLVWSSTNATTCTSTKFTTAGQTSGAVSVTPTSTTNYDLTCTNAAKSAFSTATVTVHVADLTLNVSPNTSVRRNDPATINWSVSGSPDSCLISGPGLSSTAFAGSQGIIVGQESTYTLSCIKDGLTTSKSITVKLTPAFEEF